jgi:site-specific recombinase XerC
MNTQSTLKPLTVGKYCYIVIHYKAKQNLIRVNTKLQWFDEHMGKDGLYKSTAPIEDYQSKNNDIKRLKSLVDGYLMNNSNTTRQLPTQAACIEYINNKNHKNPLTDLYTKGKEVTTYFAQWIESKQKTRKASIGTLRHLNSQLNRLKKYESTLSKKLVFEDINQSFSIEYTNWMYQKGLKAGTINKAFDILKGVLSFYATNPEYNITVNPAYLNKDFNSQRKSENLPKPLSKEEFNKLHTFQFDTEQLSNVRDMFILACTTGIRYSDLFTIDDNMVKNDCLYISPVKTKNRKKQEKNLLKINLNDISRTILTKHKNNTIQYFMTPTKYRANLKAMCKAAQINDYASHSCRDTFITFCIEEKMSIPILMSFTGHTKYEDLAKYIKINELQQNSEMQQVTAFKMSA